MRVAAEFGAATWRVCWATSYTFEPAFFEAFLVRRLGDPPLNVTVFADARRLSDTWGRLGPHDGWRVPGLNRRYLVRGVELPGAAFHAKTILLGREKRGVLLVGSGNLGIDGLENGHEVYTRIASEDEPGAFATWRDWMAGIVARVDDPLVRERWGDLRAQLPWLVAAEHGASGFVTSARRPIAEQLLDGVGAPIDELHVSAPFFDHDLAALTALLAATRPRRLVLYVGDRTSVDGRRLLDVLGRDAADVVARRYVFARDGRPAFVHAKLVAAIAGPRARILAGSANLSRPALLRVAGEGNIEAGVIREVDAAWARGMFNAHPGLALEDLPLDRLADLSLLSTSEAPAFPIRLLAATRQADGAIVLRTAPAPSDDVRLTDGIAAVAVRGDRSDPIAGGNGLQLVWLVGADGEPLSNRVPVDDPAELTRVLVAHDVAGSDRPRELDLLDRELPFYRMLQDLHEEAVFDVDDTPARARVDDARSSGDEEDPGTATFWERYFREELGRDPRVRQYSGANGATPLFLDDVGMLLLQMLHRVPVQPVVHVVEDPVAPGDGDGPDGGAGYRWANWQRLRVRGYNVLARWAAALSDPRIRWFGEFAPVRHYAKLLGALATAWPHARMPDGPERWLTADQLGRLAETLFGAFVRSARGPGYLASVDDATRVQALAALRKQGAPEVAAAIAYCVLYRANTATYFAWQPFLVPALDLGLFAPDDGAAALASDWLGLAVPPERLAQTLEHVATYLDDEHWCADAARRWGLADVTLARSGNPHVPWDLLVAGASSIRGDPRLVPLAAAALAYRRTDALRLRADGDLLVVALGETLLGSVAGQRVESAAPVFLEDLRELEAQGIGLGALLGAATAVAS